MSYTIVYDRQVIKTPTGYSLVVLDGDNNVWETNRRRARDWECWLLNKSEAEFDAFFNGMTGGKYQEHFKYNGKWVDDSALLRWYKNGLKNARTIEDFSEFVGSVHCSLIIYSEELNRKEELSRYIRTTEKFVEWISEVEKRKQSAKTERIYTVIRFNKDEPLRLPRRISEPSGEVYVTFKSKYLYEINDRGWTYGSDPRKAKIFTSLQDAKSAVEDRHDKRFAYHDAERLKKKLDSQNHVIAFLQSGYKSYLLGKTKKRYCTTLNADYAKHFTEAEAKRYASTISLADKAIQILLEEHHMRKTV